MSWFICCVRPGNLGQQRGSDELPSATGGAEPTFSSKTPTGNLLTVGVVSSFDQREEPSLPKPLLRAPSSRVRKASQHGLRLSEENTHASCLSTNAKNLNPLSYVFPFVSDENEDLSMGHNRMETDALSSNAPQGQPRNKVDFADLCGSLEDLVYLGKGSNGVVYSASWHGARVAVKFLLGASDDVPHMQRCMTEAVLTRVLSHPYVVQCFATAVSKLTPEVWEAMRVRCRRRQSLLQSSSLSRTVAAAVQQQELQERRASLDVWERRRSQLQQQLQLQQAGDRSYSMQHLRSMSPPPQSRCSPRPTPFTQQQQQSVGKPGPPGEPSTDVAFPAMLKTGALCGKAISGPSGIAMGKHHYQQQSHSSPRGQALPPLARDASIELSRQTQQRSQWGSLDLPQEEAEQLWVDMNGAGLVESSSCVGGDGGVNVLQALVDMRAEAGRHCTLVVMEYMDAGTLHEAIVRGDFSARRALEYRSKLLMLLLTAQELAQGMAQLHALDILHGDLKPTNVLLKASPCQYAGTASALQSPQRGAGDGGGGALMCTDPRGYNAKIADLGLARPCVEDVAELPSDQWGALAYLAPEAAKGSCCKSSDVYSFGVMLWEMSAGVRPYLGLTTPQVLMGLLTNTLQLSWPSDGSMYDPLRRLAVACTDFNSVERPSFEVAACILGRMVRHIRAAATPLCQRHSSALSVEAANAAATSGMAETAGGSSAGLDGDGGSGGHGSGGGSKVRVQHMTESLHGHPTTTTIGSAVAAPMKVFTAPGGIGSAQRHGGGSRAAVAAAAAAAALHLCSTGRGDTGAVTLPAMPSSQRQPCGVWTATGSGMTADGGFGDSMLSGVSSGYGSGGGVGGGGSPADSAAGGGGATSAAAMGSTVWKAATSSPVQPPADPHPGSSHT